MSWTWKLEEALLLPEYIQSRKFAEIALAEAKQVEQGMTVALYDVSLHDHDETFMCR
jgi:hypothetical protein